MIVIVVVMLLAVAFYYYYKQEEPKKILGIYSRPGKWYPLKFVAFLFMYFYSRNKNKRIDPKALYNRVDAKTGIDINSPGDLDKEQQLSDHPLAFDAAFFIASNKEGFYFVAGCERRQMGTVHSPLYIVIPGKGLFCAPKIPDTLLFGGKPSTFGAEGLLLKPIDPMKKWTISYNGKMRLQSDQTQLVDFQFEGEWISKWKYFNYETDLNPCAIARSIAKEPWSRQYFENLKRVHQVHYEQFGLMNASFTIDGISYKTQMPAFRDHSFGHKRDWEIMHRYAFHHIFLENGTCASVGVICQPCSTTGFEVGVICLPNGDVKPVKWCNLKLYQHGENGNAPKDYAFDFQAGHIVYTVQVLVEHESVHYVGKNWEARMVERFTKYVVNGVPGNGVSEFHYNNKDGRPEIYSKDDPIWYQKIYSRT